MAPVRLDPAAPRSRVKHSTIEPLLDKYSNKVSSLNEPITEVMNSAQNLARNISLISENIENITEYKSLS